MLSLILAAMAGAQTIDPAMIRPQPAPSCNAALARTATFTRAEARRLGDLPNGMIQLAVDKRVAGCSVVVLPTRDETGQHMMLMGPTPRPYLTPADRRSKAKHRLQRHR